MYDSYPALDAADFQEHEEDHSDVLAHKTHAAAGTGSSAFVKDFANLNLCSWLGADYDSAFLVAVTKKEQYD